MGIDIKYNLNKPWFAQEPKMGKSGSSGYNLFAAEEKTRKENSVTTISTHFHLEISLGCFGCIYPRSSLARYHFLDVGGGIIDSDFRDEVLVTVFNHSEEDYNVKIGDRVAQIIIRKREEINFVKCDELSKTDRDLGGFGFTGV